MDFALTTSASTNVQSIVYDSSGNNIYVAGTFSSVGNSSYNISAQNVARYDSSGIWHIITLSDSTTFSSGTIYRIKLDGNDLYACYTNTTTTVSYLYKCTLTAGTPTWTQICYTNSAGFIYDVELIGTTIYFGGRFTSINGTTGYNNMCSYNGTTFSNMNGGVVTSGGATVYVVKSNNSKLYIGGNFNKPSVNNNPLRNMAIWNSSTSGWDAFLTGTGGNTSTDTIYTIEFDASSNIYAGG